MKKMIRFFAVSLAMLAFAAATFAQVSATANATATIQAPLTISKTVDMNFGTMAATSGGTVVLASDNSVTPSAGVTHLGGTTTAASFTVTGISGATYSLTIPGTITLTSGSNTMTVNPITNTSTGNLTGGSETILVGGTLNVGAAQPAGVYTNTTDLTLEVNYN